MTRRQAALVVTGIVGNVYGTTRANTQQGRVMMLALDDVQEIVIRYRGKQVAVSPAVIVEALSGKGTDHD